MRINELLKNSCRLSFRGAAGDEESRPVFRARFLAEFTLEPKYGDSSLSLRMTGEGLGMTIFQNGSPQPARFSLRIAAHFLNGFYVAFLLLAGVLFFVASRAEAQNFPNVRCHVEDYAINAEADWQVHQPLHSVQVVVLKDPAGEQVARFDLMHGASLISLEYRGKELLFGHSAGADVSMSAIRHGTEAELKGLSPYWSAYDPDQGGTSMRVPATVAGVGCRSESTMRAFAMMIDAGVDSSFQREPLIGVWKGRISDNFPPGYSTPYALETDASWVQNPGGNPRYYLKLDQTVVNVRTAASGPMQWFLLGAAPWKFNQEASFPESCQEKSPCASQSTPAIATGRYQDAAHTEGIAMVIPTSAWHTQTLYLSGLLNPYGGVPVVRKQSFGVVLDHPLGGLTGFHFAWYFCAGSWNQAKNFAQSVHE